MEPEASLLIIIIHKH